MMIIVNKKNQLLVKMFGTFVAMHVDLNSEF